jgi:hypothetical protein
MAKHEGETFQHQKAKADVAQACMQAGYTVTLEAIGEGWRADVLATPSNSAKGQIAFEVQWSPLTLDECVLRQRRYAADDIRGCWLFRQPPRELVRHTDAGRMLRARRDLPLFHLWINADHSFAVSLNGVLIPLGPFVAALLQRQIRFCDQIIAAANQIVRGAFLSIPCPHCGGMTAIYHVQARLLSRCGIAFTPDEAWLSPAFAFHPRVIAAARAYAETHHYHLGKLARSEGGEFTFHCVRCEGAISYAALNMALYGTHALEQAYETDSFEVRMNDAQTPNAHVPHWCYSHQNTFCAL